jgi:glycosyltransferase involved in cell wall biosynthesis
VARSTFFYTDSRVLGGAENAMFMLLESLDRGDWEPTLLLDAAPGTEPLAERAAELEVPVRRVPPTPLGLSGARRVPAMAAMLRREHPALFHAHLSWPLAAKYALAAAALSRVPGVIATLQLIPEFELERSSYLQLRALSLGVDRYIAVSREIAGELIERFRWPAAKVEVVHNAVDVERFDVSAAPALRAQLGASARRPLVLTLGRLDEQKGYPVLLEAAARLPEALIVIAGKGPERPALEALAAGLGIAERVRFLGHRTDIPQLLAACDVFVLPSLYEGSSLAVLEAMAARRAVLSSAIGGTEELIDDGDSGLLVPPGDAAALEDALDRLLADRKLRETLGARARERVEASFTRQAMADQVVEIYERVLADAG